MSLIDSRTADEDAVATARSSEPSVRDRWHGAYRQLVQVACPDRLAMLEVLAAQGPLPLGTLRYRAGQGTGLARSDAKVLLTLGLIMLDTSRGGMNLEAVAEITPAGRAVVEALWFLSRTDDAPLPGPPAGRRDPHPL